MEDLQFHPIADVFPLMGGDDFRSLIEDIRKHGLLEPITLHEGKVLDGRNRYRACMEAGVAVHARDWQGEGGSPAVFVWSKNAERRQLTPSQRALAIVNMQEVMARLEAEAKARQRASGGAHLPKPVAPISEQPVEPAASTPLRTADEAAAIAGVGHSLIYEAQRLAKQAQTDPQAAELARQVTEGSMSVYQANRTLGIASPSRGGEVASQERETRAMAEDAPSSGARTLDDVTREIEDELEGSRRRSRSLLAKSVSAPPEDASDAVKASFTSRPARALVSQLIALRMELGLQRVEVTPEAIDAWWDGVETRDWERIQEAINWLEANVEPLLKYIHYKMARKSVPPMVAIIERQQRRQR